MFIYSLSGLELSDAGAQAVEIHENETTARSATFQVFGRILNNDAETAALLGDGGWVKELETATELLTFDFPWQDARLEASIDADSLSAEYQRLFVDAAATGTPPVWAGTWFEDRDKALDEVQRFYEYYGLKTSEDAPDHLAGECDFLQYLTFKEASAGSDRLRKSYRSAQLDFHTRQLESSVPALETHVLSLEPNGFYAWTVEALHRFVAADRQYLTELLGG